MWKRVVAVFLSGNDWQFKDWIHNGKFAELFMRVRGFYLHFNDMMPPEITKKWNIHIFSIPRN